MKPLSALFLLSMFVLGSTVRAAEPIEIEPDENGIFVYTPLSSKEFSREFKTPVPNIVSLETPFFPGQEIERFVPTVIYNEDATRVSVEVNHKLLPLIAGSVIIECAEESGQQADGRILFTAADARVVGKTAKLESDPGNSRIGFWTDLDDRVEWDYEATRPGTYCVMLCYSRAGEKHARGQLTIGDESLEISILPTGGWYRYQSLAAIGKVKIPDKGKLKVTVKGLESNGALMNLKGVVLKPISEGEPIQRPGEDGVILCHARDATIHGVKAQYEPKPEKNTVGFWTNPKDRVSWDVKFEQPGTYDVEILQGCGKGHGGSEVNVVMDDQTLSMVVEDTGHFQNFKPRVIGRFKVEQPGIRRFTVVPVKKVSVAVMDVRQVRLIPASKN